MVIDTKWKRISARIDDPKQGVSQADVYQMMAYGRLYGCPRLMLLYPHHGKLADAGRTGSYQVIGGGDELVTATIDLARSDARAQVEGLVRGAIAPFDLLMDAGGLPRS
jgi:5-methylcytosine-specific restriction enzyme subunit McrC